MGVWVFVWKNTHVKQGCLYKRKFGKKIGNIYIRAAEEVIWAYDLDFHQRFFGTQFLKEIKIKTKNNWVPKNLW